MLTLDSIEVNEDKEHQFQKPHHFTSEDGKAVISQTEPNFTQKQAGKKCSQTIYRLHSLWKQFHL